MRYLFTASALLASALVGTAMAAESANVPATDPAPEMGMHAGKPPSANADPLVNQHRGGALTFNSSPGASAMDQNARPGKEAAPSSADSIEDRQGRAGALTFTEGAEPGWSRAGRGSSAGMQAWDAHVSAGKPADRRDVDPIDNGRASGLRFNQYQRDLDVRN